MSTKGTRRFRREVTRHRPDLSASHGKGLCTGCGCILQGRGPRRRGTCGRCHSESLREGRKG